MTMKSRSWPLGSKRYRSCRGTEDVVIGNVMAVEERPIAVGHGVSWLLVPFVLTRL